MGSLDGKVAIITGGTRGIGRAVAEDFLAHGARVVVNGRDEAKGQAALAEMGAGDRARFHAGDILDQAVVDDLVDGAVEHYGRIDIAVLNAGGSRNPAPVVDMTNEEWELALAWNVTHAFYGIRRALAHMIPQRSGRIICMSSKQGKIGRAGIAGYVAGKHALNGLVKSVALEVGELGITANAVCAGSVLTDIVRERGTAIAAQMGLPGGLDELMATHAAESAIKRQLTPEEVAAMCTFLASDAASGITGAMLSVDGGVSPY